MIYIKLFLAFIKIGLLSVGGGYAAIPLIQEEVVSINSWLTMSEFTDLVIIAEMTPGPIAIDSAAFIGVRIAGVGGAVAATLGCILPSCIIVSILAYVYFRYKNLSAMQSILSSLRPAVVALIAGAGLSILSLVFFDQKTMSLTNMQWMSAGLFISAFIVLRKWKWNPILVMCICGALSLSLELIL